MKEHPGSWYRGILIGTVLWCWWEAPGVDWRRRPGRSQDPLSESRQLY